MTSIYTRIRESSAEKCSENNKLCDKIFDKTLKNNRFVHN